ncbi:MAG TPA: hypothetical protein VIO38_11725 [Rariglobus sp.]
MTTSNDADNKLRMSLLELSKGDLTAAKSMYAWLTEPEPTPEPPFVPEGVIVTDAEILAGDAATLQSIALARLAARQNAPGEMAA